MKKRGQLILKPTVELVVSIVVFLLFIYVGKTWGNAEVFQKARVAKEISLIIDAMHTTEGNVYINYPANVSKFNIKFFDDKVKVYSMVDDPTAYTYSFIKIRGMTLNKEIKEPRKMVLAELGDKILILDEEPNLNKVKFDNVSTRGTISGKKIAVDIDEHTLNDPKKFIKAREIVEAIKAQFSNIYLTTRTLGKGISGRATTEADILFSISIGDYEDERNTIKAYYLIGGEEKKKRKFAAIIINELVDKELYLDGANVIPTDSHTILLDADLAVLLEIGNINSKGSLAILSSKRSDVAKAIYQAIKGYYYG